MKYFALIFSMVLLIGCHNNDAVKEKLIQTRIVDDFNQTLDEKQTKLKEDLELYLIQIQSLDADNIISMTYPKLFIPINKDLFREYINILISSSDIDISSFNAKIKHIDAVHSFKEGHFATIQYQSDINLTFLNPELYSDDVSINVLKDLLHRQYGKENIKINTITRSISIKKMETLLAIQTNNNQWKFLGDNAEYRRLYPRILPEDILEKINKKGDKCPKS